LPGYQPLLEVLKKWQVKLLILRTYANPRILLPALFQLGFNCLWACETPPGEGMDYRRLREAFGGCLRLVGGIDADALRQDRAAIRREMEKVPELLAQGGYIPLLDGRVREDVPYELYCYYRSILEEMTAAPDGCLI
jgi:uroporphyrinogen decarboxylase